MDDITQQLKAYIETHPFDPGTSTIRINPFTEKIGRAHV